MAAEQPPGRPIGRFHGMNAFFPCTLSPTDRSHVSLIQATARSRKSGARRPLSFPGGRVSARPASPISKNPSRGRTSHVRTTLRFHADRTPGGHRDHRGPDRPALARRPGRARSGPAGPVHQQPQTARAGHRQLRVGEQLPAERRHLQGHGHPGLVQQARLRQRLPEYALVRPDAALPGAVDFVQRLQRLDRHRRRRTAPRLHRQQYGPHDPDSVLPVPQRHPAEPSASRRCRTPQAARSRRSPGR